MTDRDEKLVSWPEKLLKARHTWKDEGGRRLVHFELPTGDEEILEEYDIATLQLLVRKHKKQTTIGKWTDWEFEIGENVSHKVIATDLRENISNPVCIRRDDKEHFIWRIRNLPYALPVYTFKADTVDRRIIIKTHNHKYYKVLTIPDMDRMQLPLDSKRVALSHTNNTLIVKYTKPKPILELERLLRLEVKKLPEKDAHDEKAMMESVSKIMGDLMKAQPPGTVADSSLRL